MIKLLLILLTISTTPESMDFPVADKTYLEYSYEDEQHFEKGVALVEKGKYKQALKELDQADLKNLSRYDETKYCFYKGYANVKEAQYSRSLVLMKKIVDTESEYRVPARYYYAYSLYRMQRYDKALPYLLELEAMGKYRKTVPYFLTQIYYTKGEDKEVQKRAELLLAEGESTDEGVKEELHRILGEIYYRQGKYVDALANLKQVKFRNDSIGEYAYMAMGNCQVQLGQLQDAKLSYRAASQIGITPKTKEEAMYNYALCAYKTTTVLGEGITAVTNFLKAYPKSEHRSEVQAILCEALLRSKNYKGALDALDEMENPTAEMLATKQQLRYLLGTDAFAQGDMQKTVEWMTEVEKHGTKQGAYVTEALYWRAEAEYQQKNYTAAADDLTRYFGRADVDRSPNRQAAYYLRGYVFFATERYEDARKQFALYIEGRHETDDRLTDARCRIADCYYHARQYQQATDYYRLVSDQRGRGADYALYQRGFIQGLGRHHSQKVETLSELVNLYPRSRWADKGCYEIARAHVALEQNREAIRAYDALIKAYPRSPLAPQASLERAMLYRNLDETDHAITAFKATISTYPGTNEAYQALNALEQIYVSINRLSEYVTYTKSLGKMKMNITLDEDSLSLATADVQYAKKNWSAALKEYRHLTGITDRADYLETARVNIFRCCQNLKDAEGMRQAAEVLVANENPQTQIYAEAVVLLAEYQYKQGDKEGAEARAMALLQSSNQHQYWLAKALILVSDVELERGELFQAKQYLLMLQENYRGSEDIAKAVESRLKKIAEEEKRREEELERELELLDEEVE